MRNWASRAASPALHKFSTPPRTATVISKDCIDADAIATILMLLDKDKALDFIENTDQTEAYIIFFEKDSLNFIESSGFNQYKN